MAAPDITPDTAVMRGKQTQGFTSDQDVMWAVTDGTLSSVALRSVTFTAPNVTGSYVLTATNGASQFTQVTIFVMGDWPYPPSWSYEGDLDKNVIIWQPVEGDWQSQINSDTKNKIDLAGTGRRKSQFIEIAAFHDAHYGLNNFYLTHPDLSVELTVRLDAKLHWKWRGVNLVDWSTVVVEV